MSLSEGPDDEHALAAGPALRAGRRDLPTRAGQAAGRVLSSPVGLAVPATIVDDVPRVGVPATARVNVGQLDRTPALLRARRNDVDDSRALSSPAWASD